MLTSFNRFRPLNGEVQVMSSPYQIPRGPDVNYRVHALSLISRNATLIVMHIPDHSRRRRSFVTMGQGEAPDRRYV